MQEVTGPLRDAGVLIASTSKGYKIPIKQEDLYDYVKFSSSMALPMLRRIENSRKIVLQKTRGKVDILEHEEFDEIKEFFRSEEHTSELQSRGHLVCRLLLEKKNR